jgi:hypothetical protein
MGVALIQIKIFILLKNVLSYSKIRSEGNFSKHGVHWEGDSQFRHLHAIAIDSKDDVYIDDEDNSNVQNLRKMVNL